MASWEGSQFLYSPDFASNITVSQETQDWITNMVNSKIEDAGGWANYVDDIIYTPEYIPYEEPAQIQYVEPVAQAEITAPLLPTISAGAPLNFEKINNMNVVLDTVVTKTTSKLENIVGRTINEIAQGKTISDKDFNLKVAIDDIEKTTTNALADAMDRINDTAQSLNFQDIDITVTEETKKAILEAAKDITTRLAGIEINSIEQLRNAIGAEPVDLSQFEGLKGATPTIPTTELVIGEKDTLMDTIRKNLGNPFITPEKIAETFMPSFYGGKMPELKTPQDRQIYEDRLQRTTHYIKQAQLELQGKLKDEEKIESGVWDEMERRYLGGVLQEKPSAKTPEVGGLTEAEKYAAKYGITGTIKAVGGEKASVEVAIDKQKKATATENAIKQALKQTIQQPTFMSALNEALSKPVSPSQKSVTELGKAGEVSKPVTGWMGLKAATEDGTPLNQFASLMTELTHGQDARLSALGLTEEVKVSKPTDWSVWNAGQLVWNVLGQVASGENVDVDKAWKDAAATYTTTKLSDQGNTLGTMLMLADVQGQGKSDLANKYGITNKDAFKLIAETDDQAAKAYWLDKYQDAAKEIAIAYYDPRTKALALDGFGVDGVQYAQSKYTLTQTDIENVNKDLGMSAVKTYLSTELTGIPALDSALAPLGIVLSADDLVDAARLAKASLSSLETVQGLGKVTGIVDMIAKLPTDATDFMKYANEASLLMTPVEFKPLDALAEAALRQSAFSDVGLVIPKGLDSTDTGVIKVLGEDLTDAATKKLDNVLEQRLKDNSITPKIADDIRNFIKSPELTADVPTALQKATTIVPNDYTLQKAIADAISGKATIEGRITGTALTDIIKTGNADLEPLINIGDVRAVIGNDLIKTEISNIPTPMITQSNLQADTAQLLLDTKRSIAAERVADLAIDSKKAREAIENVLVKLNQPTAEEARIISDYYNNADHSIKQLIEEANVKFNIPKGLDIADSPTDIVASAEQIVRLKPIINIDGTKYVTGDFNPFNFVEAGATIEDSLRTVREFNQVAGGDPAKAAAEMLHTIRTLGDKHPLEIPHIEDVIRNTMYIAPEDAQFAMEAFEQAKQWVDERRVLRNLDVSTGDFKVLPETGIPKIEMPKQTLTDIARDANEGLVALKESKTVRTVGDLAKYAPSDTITRAADWKLYYKNVKGVLDEMGYRGIIQDEDTFYRMLVTPELKNFQSATIGAKRLVQSDATKADLPIDKFLGRREYNIEKEAKRLQRYGITTDDIRNAKDVKAFANENGVKPSTIYALKAEIEQFDALKAGKQEQVQKQIEEYMKSISDSVEEDLKDIFEDFNVMRQPPTMDTLEALRKTDGIPTIGGINPKYIDSHLKEAIKREDGEEILKVLDMISSNQKDAQYFTDDILAIMRTEHGISQQLIDEIRITRDLGMETPIKAIQKAPTDKQFAINTERLLNDLETGKGDLVKNTKDLLDKEAPDLPATKREYIEYNAEMRAEANAIMSKIKATDDRLTRLWDIRKEGIETDGEYLWSVKNMDYWLANMHNALREKKDAIDKLKEIEEKMIAHCKDIAEVCYF